MVYVQLEFYKVMSFSPCYTQYYIPIYHDIFRYRIPLTVFQYRPALVVGHTQEGILTSYSSFSANTVRQHFYSQRIVDDWNALPFNVVGARLTDEFKATLN